MLGSNYNLFSNPETSSKLVQKDDQFMDWQTVVTQEPCRNPSSPAEKAILTPFKTLLKPFGAKKEPFLRISDVRSHQKMIVTSRE